MKKHYYSGLDNINNNNKIYYQQPVIKKKMKKIENKDARLFESKNKINSNLFF